jgi:hypothetical protein
MSEIVERVAARLWKADSEDAGVPASVTARRTYDAFLDQSDDTRARWRKLARAAILEMREPTKEMQIQGIVAMVAYNRRLDGPPKPHEECVTADDWMGRGCSIGKGMYTGEEISGAWTAMIAEALR